VEKDDIIYDYILNKKEFNDFVNEHREMNVELKVLEPATAGFLSLGQHGVKNQELGIWIGNYAVHYERLPSSDDEDPRVMITLYEKNAHNNNYDECLDYFNKLYEKAEPLDDMVKRIDETLYQKTIALSTPEIAQDWDRYVGTWNKDSPPEGDFLAKVIEELNKPKSKISILDAAAATGRETIFLSKRGYKIQANSIDRNLDDKLYQNLNDLENKSPLAKIHDIRLLDQYFGREKFDLVLLIGNVLARLLDANERRRVIHQCYRILKPGGKLIVDKRNFDKMLAHKEDNAIRSFDGFYQPKFYRAKYIYCGTSVRGWPISIDDKQIDFTFGDGTKSFGRINMYPLKSEPRDELKDLLLDMNFRVDIYRDYDYTSSVGDGEIIDYKNLDADFIVYVAHKPQRE
jgi:SAM-dependent methyltransferase